MTSPEAAPLLRDLVEIPTSVAKSDFVISLAQGITDPERTVGTYVVTEQLVTATARSAPRSRVRSARTCSRR